MATYNGDANYNADVSPGEPHTVLPVNSAGVVVSGKVLSQNSGVTRAQVVLTRGNGQIYTAITNSFGAFRFNGIPSGETYTLTVNHREYRFPVQAFTANEDVSDLEITAIN